jgi:hypothetical protein
MIPNEKKVFFSKKRRSKKVKQDNELENFKKIFFALSAQTGCPSRATTKYYRFIESRITSEGAGFLKILAAQPILGLRVLGRDFPSNLDYGLKVRSRTGFPVVFSWHYQKLKALSKADPTPSNLLLVRRILSLLSIGKMLTRGSTKRIRRERELYAERVKREVDPKRLQQIRDELLPEIERFLSFVRYERKRSDDQSKFSYFSPEVDKVCLDTRTYSLKSLVKRSNRKFLYEIPYPVQKYLMRVTEDQLSEPSDQPDGKQVVIVESGGKFRGITPYYSPLVHSTSTYTSCRRVLSGWGPDVSLDQLVGHERCRKLTELNSTIVSADASNFTDSLDLELASVFLEAIGESEFLDYLRELRISTVLGPISTPLPLMGLKGCYELGCCLLAFSTWRQAMLGTLRLKTMAHACDDLVGRGTRSGFEEAYNFIGASLNTKKTVVSKTTAVFCGQMYWKGNRVTPVRLNITTLSQSTTGSVVLPMCRDFLANARPVWGPAIMRCVSRIIRRACLRCVGPNNVRFDIPSKLGGVPLPIGNKTSLVKLLEDKDVLRYALYNTPILEDPPDRQTSLIGFVRLGEPAVMPDGTVLPAVTIPRTGGPGSWLRRKKRIDLLISSGDLSDLEVYEYYYS